MKIQKTLWIFLLKRLIHHNSYPQFILNILLSACDLHVNLSE